MPLIHDRGSGGLFRTSCPDPQRIGYVYVDNLGVVGTPASLVRESVAELASHFDAAGLHTHEHALATDECAALGVLMDFKRMRTCIAPRRLAKVTGALRWALQRRSLSGRSWEILLGHITFCFLCRRVAMPIFNTIYRFIQACYWEPQPLWSSARAEMSAALGILPLVCSDWALPWQGEVLATDASESGYGVCLGAWPIEVVRSTGRVCERSRFHRAAGHSARDAFFEKAGLVRDDEGQWVDQGGVAEDAVHDEVPGGLRESEWLVGGDFPEVPVEWLSP